ncbi:hypothetical protein [Pseudomonas yamanorum]|uniref:hypothetical protein n=1 Tax=Pseudomonas yamanorum TaxID=515393 RepID=UPI003B9FCC69
MGQARQKKLAGQSFEQVRQEWLSTLSPEELVVADVASKVHKKIVKEGGMTGGCYHLSFFLKRYLKKEKNIDVDVVVGWVGEDSWDGVASHAWVEFNGKKIDVALNNTEHPEFVPTGDYILLDRVVRKGETTYSYHLDIPEKSKKALAEMAKAPDTSSGLEVTHARHARMSSMVDNDEAIDDYLRSVPTGGNYEQLTKQALLK